MKHSGRVLSFLVVEAALAVLLCSFVLAAEKPATEAVGHENLQDDYFAGETDYVSESFYSELPLIILEIADSESESSARRDFSAMYVVDSGRENRPDGAVTYSAEITLSSVQYENNDPRPKDDYFVLVERSGGEPLKAPLLGLEPNGRWFLLGGMYDKSLIRNYLGYTLARRVLPDAPDVRFCELLLKDETGYKYQGVYLLVEGDSPENSVVVRRTEHYWEGLHQTVVADDYVGKFVLQDEWGGGGKTQIDSATEALTVVSGMFYSTNTDYYLRYGEILDKKSFYAYFLINEMMANYEGMNESVYIYSPETRKLSIGTVWNFERALDNRKDEALALTRLQYQSAPFYRHMILDGEFVNGLMDIGKENSAYLSGAEFNRLIDRAVAEIGDAQARDWRRWQSFYLSYENALADYVPPGEDSQIEANGLGYDESGALLVEVISRGGSAESNMTRKRQFDTYEQEIIKLKYFVNERPQYVRKAIPLLKNQDELLSAVNAYGTHTVWAFLFLALFFCSIVVVRKIVR